VHLTCFVFILVLEHFSLKIIFVRLYFCFTAACQFQWEYNSLLPSHNPEIFNQKITFFVFYLRGAGDNQMRPQKNIVTMFIRLSIAEGTWIKILNLEVEAPCLAFPLRCQVLFAYTRQKGKILYEGWRVHFRCTNRNP